MPSHQPVHRHNQKKSASQQHKRKPEESALKTASPEAQSASLFQKGRLGLRTLSSLDLLQLQGEIGNRAAGELVTGQIQRQEEEEGPLDNAQVARALSFYRSKSAQYTPEIISQIQAGVGSPETGIADEAMVQAVARYQQDNAPLKVDGMAGPRTLPALFPSGLAEQGAITAYADAARGVIESDWASSTADQRASAILEKVNEQLTAAGVPVVGKVLEALDPNTFGQFDFTVWSISINQALLASPTLTQAQAADLADTIYHEARHGEQWFRMAQLLAGQGKSAAQIATQMGIPANIAALAFASPIQPGSMEALIADGWFQSVYGTGSAHRERVLGPTGTDIEYHNLPEESDAWRVGSSVTDAYNAGANADKAESEAAP